MNDDPAEYSLDELQDALRFVNRELYPERAAVLEQELRRRLGDAPPSPLLMQKRCAARVG